MSDDKLGVGEFTSEERERYEQEWEEISEKALLAQILGELQRRNQLLEQVLLGVDPADTDAEPDESESGYECERCNRVVPAGDRERHAREQHKCPPGAEMGLFTEVE